MLLWHVGGAVFLFRTVFRDPDVDLRFLVAGAVLPNVVDLPVGLLLHAEPHRIGRGLGHTLVLAVALMTVGMWVTRVRSPARRRAVAVAVGVMFHLLLDGMWTVPDLLLWPLPGWDLPRGVSGEWSGLPGSVFEHPIRLGQEVAGLAYLVWLGHRARLVDPAWRSRLWRTGMIES